MIQTIIEAFDLAGGDALGVVTRHGLAELRPVGGGTAPYTYAGDGQWTQIATDANGSWSYWRIAAPIVETSVPGNTCTNDFRATYQLRFVTVVDRSVCPVIEDAARAALSAMRGTVNEASRALKLKRLNADTGRVDIDSRRVYQAEFGQAGDVPSDRAIIAIDITVVALGRPECFAPCGDQGSLLCQVIESRTWEAIKACMSEAQIAAAEADLCEGGGPCNPTTVNGTESDTPTITVVQGGVEVGTLNPATGVHTVPECEPEPCDPLTITVGRAELTQVDGPCGQTVAISVLDRNGTNVDNITLNGLDIIIDDLPPLCASAAWTLKDEAGNVLDSGAIASGGAADIQAPDAKVQLKDSADNNIGGPNVYLSGSTNNLTAPDGTVTILNPNGDSLGTQAVRSNGTANFTAPIPLKFLWQAGDADTFIDPDTGEGWEVTADEAGTYTTYTQTGTNGTLTYSLNGGGYVALSGTIVLTVGDTITVRRTTTTNAGTVRWAP